MTGPGLVKRPPPFLQHNSTYEVFQALELLVFKIIEPQGQAIGIRSSHTRVNGQWGVLIER